MSTQSFSHAVPLSIADNQSPIRLLELPPDLLALIESGERPTLRFKAASSGDLISTDENQTVLCSDSKTYQIRHVHSSNSIFLLRPTPAMTEEEEDDEDVSMNDDDHHDELPKQKMQGVQITSTVSSYLELIAYKPHTNAILRKVLSAYSGPTSATPSTTLTQMQMNKVELEKCTPVSPSEFKTAWTAIDAFEHDSMCFYLTPTAAVELFTLVMTVVRSEGVDIWQTAGGDGMIIPDIVDIVVRDEGAAAWPVEAIETVLGGVCRTETERDGSLAHFIDKEVLTRWVGRRVLEGREGAVLVRMFVKMWEKVLPDECGGMALVDKLGACVKEEEGMVRFVEEVPEVVGKSVAGKKGKWHEKFSGNKKK